MLQAWFPHSVKSLIFLQQIGTFKIPCQIYFQGSHGNTACKQLSPYQQECDCKPGCRQQAHFQSGEEKEVLLIWHACNSDLRTPSECVRKAAPFGQEWAWQVLLTGQDRWGDVAPCSFRLRGLEWLLRWLTAARLLSYVKWNSVYYNISETPLSISLIWDFKHNRERI